MCTHSRWAARARLQAPTAVRSLLPQPETKMWNQTLKRFTTEVAVRPVGRIQDSGFKIPEPESSRGAEKFRNSNASAQPVGRIQNSGFKIPEPESSRGAKKFRNPDIESTEKSRFLSVLLFPRSFATRKGFWSGILNLESWMRPREPHRVLCGRPKMKHREH